ncbi:MAG: HAMP domain-containing protein, partial [Rhodospirillales bacterium]|nr:HAMP domain-containing protein [Rhodospirillales bacterium]
MVERALAEPPRVNAPRAYFDTDFRRPPLPPGVTTDDAYAVLTPDHGRIATPVTFETQVFRLSPGIRKVDVVGDIRRLVALSDDYRQLHEEHNDLILWQRTTLLNGLEAGYPGRGSYERGYDPRRQQWFTLTIADAERSAEANERDRVVWTPPHRDPFTRQMLFTAAMAVRQPDGSVAGVTSIDFPLVEVLDPARLPATWAAGADVTLVGLVDRAQMQRFGFPSPERELTPIAFAQAPQVAESGVWQADLGIATIEIEDEAARQKFFDDLKTQRSGLMELNEGGLDVYWAYGTVAEGSSLLVRLPRNVVTNKAEIAARKIRHRTYTLLIGSGIVFLLAGGTTILIAIRGARSMTQPIEGMAEVAGRIGEGDLSARVDVGDRKDEFGELAGALNDMVPKLRDRVQLRESLGLAMQVQQSLLPQAPPDVPELDIAGQSLYCDETGGDYYDYIPLG